MPGRLVPWSMESRLVLFLPVAGSNERQVGSLLDQGGNLFGMGLIDRVARACDLDRLASGTVIIPALEVGIDDLVVSRNDSTAWLGSPGCPGQQRVEYRRRCQDLRSCHELGAFARQVGCEQLGEFRRLEIGEPVRRLADRAIGLSQHAWCPLAERSLIFADIGGMRRDVDEADDI